MTGTGDKCHATLRDSSTPEYLDSVLMHFSGYIAADELYGGTVPAMYTVPHGTQLAKLCWDSLTARQPAPQQHGRQEHQDKSEPGASVGAAFMAASTVIVALNARFLRVERKNRVDGRFVSK